MSVALKTLRHVEATSLYRLKREFRAISDLCHPNIITLYELVADEDAWFFTMELINGQSIIEYVRDGRPGVADISKPGRDHVHPLPPVGEVVDLERLRDAFGQLASALAALHEIGLVHRDLKPSNVLVADSGRVVLMDFGIVAEASEARARTTVTVGTPAYMAPEQAAGDPSTAAADWYAFGAMLYLALADRLPFGGSAMDIMRSKLTRRPVPVDMMVADIPADLQRMCVRLLTRRPEHRMAAGDVLASLGVGAGADASAGPEPHWAAGQRLFVGRARELDELRAAFACVCAGQPVSVFIRGETGVGKSALLRRFLDEIAPQRGQGRGPVVLLGRCHERESLPYNALDGLIDSLSHALLSLPSHTLAGLLPANAAPLGRLFPVLLRIPHIAGADYTEADEHEPLALRARGARALYELIAALARLQPVILCLEDLHWADRDSCDLLLAMRGTPAPILLLGTVSTDSIDSVDNSGIRSIRSPSSPDITGPEVRLTAESEVDSRLESELGSRVEIERMIHRMIGAHWDCRQLTLAPLSTADRQQLLSGLVKRRRTSLEPLLSHSGRAGTANDILAEASGNPLLLMDMVRLLDESDGAIEVRNLDFDTLLGARLARLPAEARALLHAVAVAGEPIALDIAGHAAKLSAEERERAAALLRRSQLLRWVKPGSEKRLVIQHTRVRDAIWDSLSCQRKAALHRRFARALEDSDKTTVDQLARHWRAAGDRDKARGYQILAAEKAEIALAFDRAAALYQAALDLTDPQDDGARAPILQRLGGALQLAGRGYEAAQVYELAAAATDGEQALELNRLAADSWLRSGRIDNGLRRLAQVLDGLGVSYPKTRRSALLSLLLRRAQLALRRRRYRSRDAAEIPARDLARLDILYAAATTLGFLDYLRGADLQTRHLLAALRLGEAHRACRALAIDSAFLAASGGRGARKGRVLGDQMLAQARRQGDPYLLGIVQLTRGGMMLFSGHTVEAVATLAECDALLSRVRYAVEWERSTARYLRALARILSGDLVGAARMSERYVRDAENRHDVYARSLFLCIPGTWALLCADQPETADSRLDSALDGWPAGRFYMVHYLYVFARVMVRLYCGDGQGAMELLREHLLPRTRRLLLMRVSTIRGDVYALIGRAALMLGDQATVRASIRIIRRARLPYCNGMALLLEGSLRGHRGDRRGTEEALTAARECFAAASAPHMVAACELRLGMLIGGSHGEELRSRGDAALRELGVVNPERILELFVPGFPA